MMTEAEYPIVTGRTKRAFILDITMHESEIAMRLASKREFDDVPAPSVYAFSQTDAVVKRNASRVYYRNDAPGFWIFTPQSFIGFLDHEQAMMALRLLR